MAVINLFSGTFKGSVIMVGNAISLAGPGINVDYLSTANPAPPSGGTTTTYTNCSNSVFVNIPYTATVVRAELNWVGIRAGATNIAFTITDPLGITSPINPGIGQTDGYNYSNSYDITSIIKLGGNGKYTVNSIPFSIGGSGSGYAIIIAYKDYTEPYRNINIWQTFNYQNTNFNISGFATPTTGSVGGKIIVSASGGNSNQSGDSLKMGQTLATAATLTGPNNPANNFFASQVNNYLGQLDTTGTWGNANVPVGGTLSQGDRAYYDVTRVDASPGLTNNISSVNIYLNSSGDAYVVGAVALQIDVNAANNTLKKTVDKQLVVSGDTITYTVTIKNTGQASSILNTIYDTIPNMVTYVPNSLQINGVSNSGNLTLGITIPDIGTNETVTIVYQVTVNNGVPIGTTIPNTMLLNYSFVSSTALPTITDAQYSNEVISAVFEDTTTIAKSVNKNFAVKGDTITYSIIIDNLQSPFPLINSYFVDTIPNYTIYIPNSLTLNGINLSIPSISIPTSLMTIPANTINTITFNIMVNTIAGTLINDANIIYGLNVIGETTPVSKVTNIVTTTLLYPNPEIIKEVNEVFATIGSTITYRINVYNGGNIDLNNCIVIDTLPDGAIFVPNSMQVDSIPFSGSPNIILIGTIPVGRTIRITYDAVIV